MSPSSVPIPLAPTSSPNHPPHAAEESSTIPDSTAHLAVPDAGPVSLFGTRKSSDGDDDDDDAAVTAAAVAEAKAPDTLEGIARSKHDNHTTPSPGAQLAENIDAVKHTEKDSPTTADQTELSSNHAPAPPPTNGGASFVMNIIHSTDEENEPPPIQTAGATQAIVRCLRFRIG
jgi:hypothetical protein